MAPWGEESREGEEVSAECRALQAATTARPTRGRSFHVSSRTKIPDVAKAMEEQTAPKTREAEAQEERLGSSLDSLLSSLLYSLIGSLLGSLLDSLLGSLLGSLIGVNVVLISMMIPEVLYDLHVLCRAN